MLRVMPMLGTRYFEVRDGDRVYVEMRDAVTDAKVGRRAVLRIAGVDGTGAITEIEVVDPGFGYEYDYVWGQIII